MNGKVVKPIETVARASYTHVRMDLPRDARMMVTRNVTAKHVHITLGQSEATLIIHPHAAKRLIANIAAVLEGEDFSCD